MQDAEIIIGFCLIAIGIAISIQPASWVITALVLGSTIPPSPAPLWFMILFFLLGVGAWFLVTGLKSKAIVSKPKT